MKSNFFSFFFFLLWLLFLLSGPRAPQQALPPKDVLLVLFIQGSMFYILHFNLLIILSYF